MFGLTRIKPSVEIRSALGRCAMYTLPIFRWNTINDLLSSRILHFNRQFILSEVVNNHNNVVPYKIHQSCNRDMFLSLPHLQPSQPVLNTISWFLASQFEILNLTTYTSVMTSATFLVELPFLIALARTPTPRDVMKCTTLKSIQVKTKIQCNSQINLQPQLVPRLVHFNFVFLF